MVASKVFSMPMKKRNQYQSHDLSFDDFMNHTTSAGLSDKSVSEIAEETAAAKSQAEKKSRELKKEHQRRKRSNKSLLYFRTQQHSTTLANKVAIWE